MGRHHADLIKYIDDVLMLNGDIDEKIDNLEDDIDSLVDEQEALDLQIAPTGYLC